MRECAPPAAEPPLPGASKEESLSEFYLLRRSAIADATAVLGFLAGFVGSAPIAWPYLQVGFQTGEITEGFAYFIGVICGSGVAGGVAGLALGTGAAWFWERGHRTLRRARERSRSRDQFMGALERPASAPPAGAASPDTAPASVILREGDVDAAAYARLLSRATGGSYLADDVAASLAATSNIGAWEGDTLIGVARLTSGPSTRAVLAELLVDPAHRERGIGTELAVRVLGRPGGWNGVGGRGLGAC